MKHPGNKHNAKAERYLSRAGYAAGGRAAAEAIDEGHQTRGMTDDEASNYTGLREKYFSAGDDHKIGKGDARYHATNPPGRVTPPGTPDPWARPEEYDDHKRGGRTPRSRRAQGGPLDASSPQQQMNDALKRRDRLDESDEDGRRMEIAPGRARSADKIQTPGMPIQTPRQTRPLRRGGHS